MALSRRELLASGVMSGAAFKGRTSEEIQPEASEGREIREINQTLKSLVTEVQRPEHSVLPGDVDPVGQLRNQMIEFMKATNKWPDFVDVGSHVWFAIYDWHIRFRLVPAVVRMPDQRYGLTFMFTTLILRTEQTPSYIGLPYDKDR